MANKGILDKKLGIDEIRKNIKKLSETYVIAGIPESKNKEVGGVSIAQYAAWNEYGADRGNRKDYIPSRPFMRQAVENNLDLINGVIEKYYKIVSMGKMLPDVAASQLGQFMEDLIKKTIKNGNFKENSDVTKYGSKPGKDGKQFIKPKKSTKPLIDGGTLYDTICYQVKTGKKPKK